MITHYVGIDIPFKTATIAWQSTPDDKPTVIEIQQTSKAYKQLIKQLKSVASPEHIHVVMEATGTYWMKIAYALFDAQFVVSVVNPRQPKNFAKMRLQRAKIDAIDAVMLMDFASFYQPDPWTPPPSICETLRQYLTYRTQLIDLRTIVKNQLHAFEQNPNTTAQLLDSMKDHRDRLTAEIDLLTTEIDDLLIKDPQWAQASAYLKSIPGIGTLSTAWLLVATHCFARCETPQQAASFAGLAPHPKDSGDQYGHRSIGGTGHQALRNTLYMASASVSRFNPVLKPYYDQLVARGKPKKVVAVLWLVS